MLTHRNICNNVWSISTYLGNTPDDIVLCVLPLAFDYGLFQILTGARVGFTVVLAQSFAYPIKVLELVGKHRVDRIPRRADDFRPVLHIWPFDRPGYVQPAALSPDTAGGLSASTAHSERLANLFAGSDDLFPCMASPRTPASLTLDPGQLVAKPTSVGQASPTRKPTIVDEDGRPLGPGETPANWLCAEPA